VSFTTRIIIGERERTHIGVGGEGEEKDEWDRREGRGDIRRVDVTAG